MCKKEKTKLELLQLFSKWKKNVLKQILNSFYGADSMYKHEMKAARGIDVSCLLKNYTKLVHKLSTCKKV